MAHRFSNFADAYAYLDTRWSICRSYQNDAYDYASAARDYANAGNWKQGIKYNSYAIGATLTAFDILFECYNHDIDYSVHGECFYWASQEGGNGELTMAMILDAIWASSPLETFFFVNDIDAMRAAIWNKEISAEKLHELYRHFLI